MEADTLTTQATIKREVEQLKSIVNVKPPKDIWLVWAGSDDPEETVEAFRVVSKDFPNNATIRCKRKDLDKKIEEAKKPRVSVLIL